MKSENVKNYEALTIRQPWAWAILQAGKDIENRDWATRYRGPVWIHAAKTCTQREYDAARLWMQRIGVDAPRLSELTLGAIIGRVRLVDCVRESDSPWFMGECGFVLSEPEPCQPVFCKGALGFWTATALMPPRPTRGKAIAVHCGREPYDVYVGRKMPGLAASKWQNPFKATEPNCLEWFRDYLLNSPELLADLHELKGKRLGCWCAPNACHGDILAAMADSF